MPYKLLGPDMSIRFEVEERDGIPYFKISILDYERHISGIGISKIQTIALVSAFVDFSKERDLRFKRQYSTEHLTSEDFLLELFTIFK